MDMHGVLQDIRFELRQWARKPGFTFIAILTLALGAGANALMFTIIDSVLLRSLPYPESQQIVLVRSMHSNSTSGSTSLPNFLDVRAESRTLSSLAAFDNVSASLRLPDGTPVHSSGVQTTAGLFDVLRVGPMFGRVFSSHLEKPGEACAVVVSAPFWRERLSADRRAIGEQIVVNGKACTISGVMPDGFSFPSLEAEFWVPLQESPDVMGRGTEFLDLVGRLKPGITLQSARSEIETIGRRLAKTYPEDNKGVALGIQRYQESVTGEARPALLALLGAVGLLLLIACGNIANLQLARALARKREIAVRAALGAGKTRIARQLLIESLLLAVVGTAAGLGLASVSLNLVKRITINVLPRARELDLHPEVCLAMLAVASLSVLFFGLAPVWQAVRQDIETALRESGGAVVGGRKQQRLRDLLVVAQLSLAIVLLAGSGLLLHSLYRLLHADTGFTTQHVLTLQTALSGSEPPKADLAATVYGPELDEIEHIAGVQAAGFITYLPLGHGRSTATFIIPGRPLPRPGSEPFALINATSDDFFAAMQIPLLKGRFFSRTDALKAPRVAIVNDVLARLYFPGENPVGKQITFDDPDFQARPLIIVGVVRGSRQLGLAAPPQPELYFNFRQVPPATLWSQFLLERIMTYVVRGSGDPAALANDIQRAIHRVDPSQTIFHIETMKEIVSSTVESRRLGALLLSVFSALALLVSAAGLYAVLSYLVSQRKRDIAIRMALGARRDEVVRMVISRAVVLYAVSVAIGLAAVLACGPLLASIVPGVQPWDPAALTGTTLVLIAAALLAAWFPAQRAAATDPYEALRNE